MWRVQNKRKKQKMYARTTTTNATINNGHDGDGGDSTNEKQ